MREVKIFAQAYLILLRRIIKVRAKKISIIMHGTAAVARINSSLYEGGGTKVLSIIRETYLILLLLMKKDSEFPFLKKCSQIQIKSCPYNNKVLKLMC